MLEPEINRFQVDCLVVSSFRLSLYLHLSICLSIYVSIYRSIYRFFLSLSIFLGTQRRLVAFFLPVLSPFSLLALCLVSSHLIERLSLHCSPNWKKLWIWSTGLSTQLTPSSRRESLGSVGTWLPWRNVCSWLHDGRVERVRIVCLAALSVEDIEDIYLFGTW